MFAPDPSAPMPPMDLIRADFDRLARLTEGGWNHNVHYHSYLLNHVNQSCRHALDLGCGTGGFSRALARRCGHVLAIDLAPEMIRVADGASAGTSNITYEVADALTRDFPRGHFDAIASIATLHHLPMDVILPKLAAALRPGGTLVVLDLYRSEGLADGLTDLLAVPASHAMNLLKNGRLRRPREVRDAWNQHAKHDHFLTRSTIRSICSRFLPGAAVRRHLFWRYSLVWHKPMHP